MIKIGIIDDEILARKVIEEYCSKIDNFELVLSTGNPLEFINFVQQNEVDLIFLDIEMPELNGMEILRSMVKQPKVILTTAYSEYALEFGSLYAKSEITKIMIYKSDGSLAYASNSYEVSNEVSSLKKGICYIQIDFSNGQLTKKITI